MQAWLVVLLLACVAVAVITALHGIYAFLGDRAEERQRELSRRMGTMEAARSKGEALALAGRDQLAAQLGSTGAWLEAMVQQAGGDTSVKVLLMQIGLAAFGTTVLLGVLLRSPVALVGVFAGAIPLVILINRGNKRARAISEQLPDALDLMGRSLQAGHGLNEAMRVCADETNPPLAHELGRTWEQQNLGLDFRQCLGNLVSRNPRSFDLRLFSGSVLLQRETGGNLVEIVDNIADTIRGRFTLEAKVNALTSEARFSGLILGGLPLFVAAAVLAMRPNYLQPLLVDPLGRTLLGYAVLSYVLGAVVLRRMSKLRT
jgi:tight adherence protein B